MNDIEALATLRGLQIILYLGYSSLQLERDSLIVIARSYKFIGLEF